MNMVKLSTLNKYKGKLINIQYYDEELQETTIMSGIIDEVEQNTITVEYADESGFEVIQIDNIKSVTRVE